MKNLTLNILKPHNILPNLLALFFICNSTVLNETIIATTAFQMPATTTTRTTATRTTTTITVASPWNDPKPAWNNDIKSFNFYKTQQKHYPKNVFQVSKSALFAKSGNDIAANNENEHDNNKSKKHNNKFIQMIRKAFIMIQHTITYKALLKVINSSFGLTALGFLLGTAVLGSTKIPTTTTTTPLPSPPTPPLPQPRPTMKSSLLGNIFPVMRVLLNILNILPMETSYSDFLSIIKPSEQRKCGVILHNVLISKNLIRYEIKYRGINPRFPPVRFYANRVPASPEVVKFLHKHKIDVWAVNYASMGIVSFLLASVVFGALYYFVGGYILRRIDSDREIENDNTPGTEVSSSDVTFDDIQGIDEAKLEVMELVDTIKNPEKYASLGARAPTGLLLEGPPGTGKTLLARATAAAADVPLISCSGSDFVEIFIGRGAARVRRLFEKAAKAAPCIIFIDELDSVGQKRDDLLFGYRRGGNDEADQTLNQLLACMDGLDSSKQICVLAATNRKNILDPALIRPGRFDRIVSLQLPDTVGRENILRVHANKLPTFKECCVGANSGKIIGNSTAVDLSAIAAMTPGASGAELEYIVNEAAIHAVRRVIKSIRNDNKDDDETINNDKINVCVTAQDFEKSLKTYQMTRGRNENTNNDNNGKGRTRKNLLLLQTKIWNLMLQRWMIQTWKRFKYNFKM